MHAFVNMVGLYTGGLIFVWAYIWNALSITNMVGLCMGDLYWGGGLIFWGRAYRRGFTH